MWIDQDAQSEAETLQKNARRSADIWKSTNVVIFLYLETDTEGQNLEHNCTKHDELWAHA